MLLLWLKLQSFFHLLILVSCCVRTSISFSVSPMQSRSSSTILQQFSRSTSLSVPNVCIKNWRRNKDYNHIIRNAMVDDNILEDDLGDIDLDEIPPAADFIDPTATWVKTSSSTTTATTATSSTRREYATAVGNEKTNETPSSSVAPNGSAVAAATASNTYVRCGVCSSHFAITPEELGGERSKGR
jgi:hypothetical protein